ncbi:phage antirepressor N-terminal domain-containing protein, partial [Lysinibacillus sphaericus]
MNPLQVIEQKTIPFDGTELIAVKMNDDKIYVAVKWVCEGIGLSEGQTKSERKKIQEDLVLKRSGRNIVLNTNGGLRDILCIELGFLPLWLAKITLTPTMQRENPWTVQRLVDFQLKAKDALEEAFLNKPKSQLEIMQMQIEQMIKQEREIIELKETTARIEAKQDSINEIIALNPNEWRKKTTTLLNKVAVARGGFEEYRKVRNESYERLEDRAHCRLERRLTNRQREMALNGVSRSKIDRLSKLDVIAEDAKLVEIYLSVVKDMAIAHQVNT